MPREIDIPLNEKEVNIMMYCIACFYASSGEIHYNHFESIDEIVEFFRTENDVQPMEIIDIALV